MDPKVNRTAWNLIWNFAHLPQSSFAAASAPKRQPEVGTMKVCEGVTKLVRNNSNLSLDTDKIGERSHDRHGKCSLSGTGYNEEIEHGLEDIHKPCGDHRREILHSVADAVKDRI